jgi:hypothetical protein
MSSARTDVFHRIEVSMPAYLNEARQRLPAILSELTEESVVSVRSSKVWSERTDLVLRVGKHRYAMMVRSAGTVGQVSRGIRDIEAIREALEGEDVIPVLVVPFMSREGAELCRAFGIHWLDLAGNARILTEYLRILATGRPRKVPYSPRSVDPFSPKRSRVAHVLLRHPKKSLQQGEIARLADLSEGYTSQILSLYEELGFVRRDRREGVLLQDPGLLLLGWRETYKFSQHGISFGHVPARSGTELMRIVARALKNDRIPYAMTGLAAAWLLAPFAGFRMVTVYVEEQLHENRLKGMGFRSGMQGANLRFVLPRDAGVFIGSSSEEDISHVDPIQTYLDLKDHPERSQKAAESIRDRYLGDLLHE